MGRRPRHNLPECSGLCKGWRYPPQVPLTLSNGNKNKQTFNNSIYSESKYLHVFFHLISESQKHACHHSWQNNNREAKTARANQPQTFGKGTKDVQVGHSYLHRIIEGFEHPHALGTELQVHRSFHSQGEALVLDRILPRYDHHPGEHFLGRGDSHPTH